MKKLFILLLITALQIVMAYAGKVEFTIKPLDSNGNIIEICWATIF